MRHFAAILLLLSAVTCRPAGSPREDLPNFVLLYADDLGYGEVGAYGQQKIHTPNLDRMAAEGLLFTQHYSGSAVCAPSRAVLLTGKHTGHAAIRDNRELGGWGPDEPEGQWPLPDAELTLAEALRQRGYATGAFGKWGLGGPDSEGVPERQGFDCFVGDLCQRVAHNYYPTHLWRNGAKLELAGNVYFDAHQRIERPPQDPAGWEQYQGVTYAPDVMLEQALEFLDEHAAEPFFLYFATPLPHVALQVPEEALAEYVGQFEETPYLGQRGYLPHPTPRAAYAAMVTRMDRDFGRIIDRIDQLGLGRRTLVLFSSDNGPTFNGGTDSDFFHSSGPFRGHKTQLYEGGIRVPLLARWTDTIRPGRRSDLPSAQWDLMPTVLELAGVPRPPGLDGISLGPTLLARSKQPRHGYLYWELGKQQAIRVGHYKLLRVHTQQGDRVELYDLLADVGESHDLAPERPGLVARMLPVASRARVPSEAFPSPFDR